MHWVDAEGLDLACLGHDWGMQRQLAAKTVQTTIAMIGQM